MTARDLFSVALRVLGVWFLYDALDSGVWLFLRKIGVVRMPTFPVPTEDKIAEHVFFILFYLFLTIILLSYGDQIASAFYRPAKPATAPDDTQDPSTLE